MNNIPDGACWYFTLDHKPTPKHPHLAKRDKEVWIKEWGLSPGDTVFYKGDLNHYPMRDLCFWSPKHQEWRPSSMPTIECAAWFALNFRIYDVQTEKCINPPIKRTSPDGAES